MLEKLCDAVTKEMKKIISMTKDSEKIFFWGENWGQGETSWVGNFSIGLPQWSGLDLGGDAPLTHSVLISKLCYFNIFAREIESFGGFTCKAFHLLNPIKCS